MARVLLGLVAVCLLTRCTRSPLALGEDPLDEVQLSAAPELAHYVGALAGAESMRVRDLYARELEFAARPSPRSLLEAQQAGNPARAGNATTLRVLTYNVALLDAKVFGLIRITATPDLEARAPMLFPTVFAEGYDIITFQEVWRAQDVERMRAAAETAGYWVVTSERRGGTDGLAIAVKKTLSAAPGEVTFQPYAVPASDMEFFPAPGLSRAFISVRFDATGIGPVVVYNTHATAFPARYAARMSNVSELGLHLRHNTSENELVLVGGDMNAAPYYRANDWTLPDGTQERVWFANTLSYGLMLHYGGLVDLATRGRQTPAEALGDITEGDLVPADVDEAYCATVPNVIFTGTDCNPLYRQQYEDEEFPARLDYVFARDPSGRVHVSDVSLAFVEDVAYGDKTGPLSDHYGQAATLQIAP
jgi:exonuclease III